LEQILDSTRKKFFSNLRAALSTGVALDIGEAESSIRRLTRGQLKRESGEIENSPRLQAACEVYQRTGSMGVVLDSLSVRMDVRKKIGRLFLNSFVYLFVLIVVAIGGMVLFRQHLLPVLQAIRHDLLTLAKADLPAEHVRSIVNDASAVSVVVFIVILVLLLLWLCFGGRHRTASWLGGKQYLHFRSLEVALRCARLLLASGLPANQAIRLACDTAALDDAGKADLAVALSSDDVSRSDLAAWNDFLRLSAQRKFAAMKGWGARFVVIIIGGPITCAYATIVFSPLVAMLIEMVFRSKA